MELAYLPYMIKKYRILAGRPAGSTPYTLLDYFPDDYLTIIDESHVTVPQIRAMYGGDLSTGWQDRF